MTAASEARRIALMLNDSKWQEIEEEIRKAIEAAGILGGEGIERAAKDIVEAERSGGYVGLFQIQDILRDHWRDQPDGVR